MEAVPLQGSDASVEHGCNIISFSGHIWMVCVMQMCDANVWIFLMLLNIWNDRKSIILFMPGFVSHICCIRLHLTLQKSAGKEILKMWINTEDPQELLWQSQMHSLSRTDDLDLLSVSGNLLNLATKWRWGPQLLLFFTPFNKADGLGACHLLSCTSALSVPSNYHLVHFGFWRSECGNGWKGGRKNRYSFGLMGEKKYGLKSKILLLSYWFWISSGRNG